MEKYAAVRIEKILQITASTSRIELEGSTILPLYVYVCCVFMKQKKGRRQIRIILFFVVYRETFF